MKTIISTAFDRLHDRIEGSLEYLARAAVEGQIRMRKHGFE